MENQISNIITILTALLTGGFLMLFIENQQITTYVIERLHQRMNPFFHSFTNYVKFVSSFESCYIWRKCTSSYMKCLKQYVKDISESNSVALKEYIEKSCPLVIAFPPYIDMEEPFLFYLHNVPLINSSIVLYFHEIVIKSPVHCAIYPPLRLNSIILS